MLRLCLILAFTGFAAPATFFLPYGRTTYIQVTTKMEYHNASLYCHDRFNGKLAVVDSDLQLQTVNLIVAQGNGLEGFMETDRTWTEMWVGGKTDSTVNSLVDARDIEIGENVLIFSNYKEEGNDCYYPFCLFAKLESAKFFGSIEKRRFLCESQSMQFNMVVSVTD